MKIIVELINPSDAITFVMDDPTVAGIGVLLLGNGWYGLLDAEGNHPVPPMLGGVEAWFKERGIESLNKWIKANGVAVAEFLETCAYGNIVERDAYDRAIALMTPENAAIHREWWNDRNRSSMNNIGAAALKLAANLRQRAAGKKAELKGSPPRVFASRS